MPSNSLGPFFSKKLGFVVAFTYGDPPFYGQVARDGARLNLRCMPMPIIDPQLRDKEDLLSASITLDDAKPLYLEYQAAGVAFHQTLRTEPGAHAPSLSAIRMET